MIKNRLALVIALFSAGTALADNANFLCQTPDHKIAFDKNAASVLPSNDQITDGIQILFQPLPSTAEKVPGERSGKGAQKGQDDGISAGSQLTYKDAGGRWLDVKFLKFANRRYLEKGGDCGPITDIESFSAHVLLDNNGIKTPSSVLCTSVVEHSPAGGCD